MSESQAAVKLSIWMPSDGQAEIDDDHDHQRRHRAEHVDQNDDQQVDRPDLEGADDGEHEAEREARDHDRQGASWMVTTQPDRISGR